MNFKIKLFIFLILFHIISNGQILYLNSCNVICEKCGTEDIMKVEYKADADKQLVLRIIDNKDVDVQTDCKILDKNNWSCDGIGLMKNLGKQYAANGVAYWNSMDSTPDYKKVKGETRMCTYDKNFIGQYKLRK